MLATWSVLHVDPNSPAAPLAEDNWVATSAIWPWKKWPPQSCFPVDISPLVVASPYCTPRKQITKKRANLGLILALVRVPAVNGRDHWNKSCRISCKSTSPSQLYKERTYCSTFMTLYREHAKLASLLIHSQLFGI